MVVGSAAIGLTDVPSGRCTEALLYIGFVKWCFVERCSAGRFKYMMIRSKVVLNSIVDSVIMVMVYGVTVILLYDSCIYFLGQCKIDGVGSVQYLPGQSQSLGSTSFGSTLMHIVTAYLSVWCEVRI